MTLAATARLAEGRSLEEVAALADRVRGEARRRRTAREFETPLDLAAAFDPTIVRTPALDLINDRIAETVGTYSGRLVISVPPQEGKTTLLRWTCAHALIRNPDIRIAYASYAASLARASGRIVRGLITTHHDSWGLGVSRDHADASDWQLQGHQGGTFTCGIGGSLTGRPANCMIIDDPLKGRAEADSETILGNLHEWWRAVARTRWAPGAWVIVVQTRWTEDDLAGRLVADGWPLVNIPAVADGHAPDALGRPEGEYLISARGRTRYEWEDTRRDVGEREWQAMYQGMPAQPEGGIFKRAWFERDRVTERPQGATLVYVDPADNPGDGDEAGILVGSIANNQRIYVGPDYSGHYTMSRWIRVALLALVRHNAGTMAYERSLSGLDRSTKHGWRNLYKQAGVLCRICREDPWPDQPLAEVVEDAAVELTHAADAAETIAEMRADLIELWPLVPAALDYPDTGPIIRKIDPKGQKETRAQVASTLYQDRRISHVGYLTSLEHQMATWQIGQKSPDRMDTAVHVAMDLSGRGPATLQRPVGNIPTRSTSLRQRGGAITRSTRR